MQRIKRKFRELNDKTKSQDTPTKIIATVPIATIILVKLQIYTIRLLSLLPSTYDSTSLLGQYNPLLRLIIQSIHWILLKNLNLLHKLARAMHIERLVPSEDSPQYTIITDETSLGSKAQPKLSKAERLRLHKEWTHTNSGLLDPKDISTLDSDQPVLTEEERHLKKLLDFVDDETI
ncbi:hypothetical protein K501DRAFT_89160 [Backusella circina FSU 941]|nr:hypothetical protein K501DRAFT_89160 [Backusella circina FSU 941]